MQYNHSLFCQILKVIPRAEFERLVRGQEAEKHSKGFSCWEQLVAMLFAQLAGAVSLREIESGMKSACGKLNHLGVPQAPPRSTLAYANSHRPVALFEQLFYVMVAQCERFAPGKKARFRFKSKLFSLDASVIELCLGLFPWAKFRQTKGAVKLHTLLDHDGYFPCFLRITTGKEHDVRTARLLKLPPESIVAMDRGYNDYALFDDWTRQRIWFVSREKANMVYDVVESRAVPARGNVRADEVIRLSSPRGVAACPSLLRRVVVWDEKKQEEIVLLTNNLELGATTIGAIYKDRWQIELFFKAIKQNLKIKTFLGTSQNALHLQLWTAMLAILLIKFLQWQSRAGLSLSNLIALLRWNLFTYRPLFGWLDDPYATPPTPTDAGPWQPELALGV